MLIIKEKQNAMSGTDMSIFVKSFPNQELFQHFSKLLIYWSHTIVKKLSEDPRSYINRLGYKNLHILGSYQGPYLYSNQIFFFLNFWAKVTLNGYC